MATWACYGLFAALGFFGSPVEGHLRSPYGPRQGGVQKFLLFGLFQRDLKVSLGTVAGTEAVMVLTLIFMRQPAQVYVVFLAPS